MGQEYSLRKKLSERLSRDAQGVVRTLKSAGVKLSSSEEASISRGNLDQFSDAQLGERFSPKILGMLGISSSSAEPSQYRAEGRQGSSGYPAEQGKSGQSKTDYDYYQGKKQKKEKQ